MGPPVVAGADRPDTSAGEVTVTVFEAWQRSGTELILADWVETPEGKRAQNARETEAPAQVPGARWLDTTPPVPGEPGPHRSRVPRKRITDPEILPRIPKQTREDAERDLGRRSDRGSGTEPNEG